MRLKKILSDLLATTKAERNGAIVLSVLILLLITVRFLIPQYIKKQRTFNDYSAIISRLDSLSMHKLAESEAAYLPVHSRANQRVKPESEATAINYFHFNPNTVSSDELIMLGFNSRTANTFIRFRSGGAVFRKPNDLLRVYGIDSALYNALVPYMQFELAVDVAVGQSEQFEKPKPAVRHTPEKIEIKTVELNSADSAMLTTLSGIGPVFARRICSFRDALGGFYHVEQLTEVFNFPVETFLNVKQYISVDSTIIKKIDLNFADVNKLRRHPYCDAEMARRIVDHRSKNGSFTSVEQLLTASIIDSSSYARLSSYLKVYQSD